tara:strand:- start:787 stop:1425 length:639 start_codon:yes stop_codon:yes gene_type:complete
MSSTVHDITKHLRTTDISAPKPLGCSKVISKNIWDAYTSQVCKNELVFFQKRKDRLNLGAAGGTDKRVVYFSSTENRKMFSRLIVFKTLENNPFSTSEAANELRITHKAATEMIKETLALDAICVDERASKTTKQSRYVGCCSYIELFKQVYMLDVYALNSDTERLRQLVTEFDWYERNQTEYACRTDESWSRWLCKESGGFCSYNDPEGGD